MFPQLESVGIRRKKLGLTQSSFAKSIGLSQSMLTKIERGKTVPNYNIAVQIFSKLEQEENRGEISIKDVMKKTVIELKPSDSIQTAAKIAKKHGISQFPVTQNGKIVGSIRTSDLIGLPKEAKVGWKIEAPFPTVHENSPISVVKKLLAHNPAVIVVRKDQIIGLVTAEDLL